MIIIMNTKADNSDVEKLKNVLGHKFVEVIGGFVVGLAVPLILCPLFL